VGSVGNKRTAFLQNIVRADGRAGKEIASHISFKHQKEG